MAPYATDLIAQKRDLEKRRDAIDPFQKLNPIDEKSPGSTPEPSPEASSNTSKDTSSEWYVEEVDEGVDHYMFPRMMGYLVLEKQYELYPPRPRCILELTRRFSRTERPTGRAFSAGSAAWSRCRSSSRGRAGIAGRSSTSRRKTAIARSCAV